MKSSIEHELGLASIQAPFSAGVFLAAHGEAERVAYADLGIWTGAPIPAPTTCPSLAGAEICGGLCGGCPVGQICTGRSPLHPYGVCHPIDASTCAVVPVTAFSPGVCKGGEKCFVFTVEAKRQALADTRGLCMPTSQCEATAANLPGGGKCAP